MSFSRKEGWLKGNFLNYLYLDLVDWTIISSGRSFNHFLCLLQSLAIVLSVFRLSMLNLDMFIFSPSELWVKSRVFQRPNKAHRRGEAGSKNCALILHNTLCAGLPSYGHSTSTPCMVDLYFFFARRLAGCNPRNTWCENVDVGLERGIS